MSNQDSFWQRIRRETEPIVTHVILVLVLEVSLIVIGLIALGLEPLFSHETFVLNWIKKVDIWGMLILLCLLTLYTVILVGIRLFRGVKEEYYSGKKGAEKK